jgi:prepilin-type N-terminal cleavage/methylation domain-containing protein
MRCSLRHGSDAVPTLAHRQAFTLIELLIAISLSSLIIYTAMAAFRTVSQSVTQSRRLAVENNLMRTGFYAALDELDFWDLYDDRYAPDPATNPLRAAGKPFNKLTYDSTKLASDPKRWWRGFGFSSDAKDVSKILKWGNYALLSRNDHAGASDSAVRSWYPDQIKAINTAIGGYGMVSYLPGDAIFCWYTGAGASSLTMNGTPRDVWERTANVASPQGVSGAGTPGPVTVNGLSFDKGQNKDFLPVRPAHWPGLTVETRRYAVWSSFIDLCQVQVQSPFTGETQRLSFWGVGTTLRGARQQRDLDTVVIK